VRSSVAMDEQEPQTIRGRQLREGMRPARWEASVREALRRVEIVEAVAALRVTGKSWRTCLSEAAPDVGWSKYLHWRRRYDSRDGPAWEALLDRRVPPPRPRVDDAVSVAARALRRSDRSINVETARILLREEFGPELEVSDTWLKRRWADAGLQYVPKAEEGKAVGEEVEEYHGGGGLALIMAADIEVGASLKLAEAALAAGKLLADRQPAVVVREEGENARDAQGRFTGDYNRVWRDGQDAGERDRRWASDESKRATRELAELPLLKHAPETLASKLLCMGTTGLVTARRGFDGLDGPMGQWLAALGGHAYMPATLDKALGQLGLLGVDGAMWQAHARVWAEQSRRWCADGEAWKQVAAHIDSTADPYWTHAYARSGKVSIVGRVMPCVSRVALVSGAGVPLLVETHAGTTSLKQRIGPMLEKLDEAIGPAGEVSRMVIVDAEAGNVGTLHAIHTKSERVVITVLKGHVQKGAKIHHEGAWIPYRERDQIREVEIDLDGSSGPEGGINLRGIQMRREGRHSVTTLFATNAKPDELDAAAVVSAYLSRWPNIEQLFRDGRNGVGLNRTHGYGGGEVTNVALETKLEQATRSADNAKAGVARAQTLREELAGRTIASAADKQALALADRELKRAESTLAKREARHAELQTTPTTIYERDVGRDSIMTCLKLSLCMLMEFVLQEYFGKHRMEWRTFIEQFVTLPVTVRTTRARRLYQIHANNRQPDNLQRLAEALRILNTKKLRRDKRLLAFELVGLPERGS